MGINGWWSKHYSKVTGLVFQIIGWKMGICSKRKVVCAKLFT